MVVNHHTIIQMELFHAFPFIEVGFPEKFPINDKWGTPMMEKLR
jgi:hypothetical protein